MKSRFFRAPRILSGLIAGLLAVLLLPALTSALVWCHKPNGWTEIERENRPGECLCDQCEHCREQSSADPREGSPLGPALTADHCHHEAAAAAAPAVFLENKSSQDTALLFGAPISTETGLTLPGSDLGPRIVAIPLSSGPPGGPLFSFRC